MNLSGEHEFKGWTAARRSSPLSYYSLIISKVSLNNLDKLQNSEARTLKKHLPNPGFELRASCTSSEWFIDWAEKVAILQKSLQPWSLSPSTIILQNSYFFQLFCQF